MMEIYHAGDETMSFDEDFIENVSSESDKSADDFVFDIYKALVSREFMIKITLGSAEASVASLASFVAWMNERGLMSSFSLGSAVGFGLTAAISRISWQYQEGTIKKDIDMLCF
jgi:hypothetical protein